MHSRTRRGRPHAHQQLQWHVQQNVTLAGDVKGDTYTYFQRGPTYSVRIGRNGIRPTLFFSDPSLRSSKQLSGLSLSDIRCIELTKKHPSRLFLGNTLNLGPAAWKCINGINDKLTQEFCNMVTGDIDMSRCVLERFVSRVYRLAVMGLESLWHSTWQWYEVKQWFPQQCIDQLVIFGIYRARATYQKTCFNS